MFEFEGREVVVASWMLLAGCAVMALSGWWCQVRRYPQFRVWSPDIFCQRHQLHKLQISVIVIPGMLSQLGGTALLVLAADTSWLLKLLHVSLCVASIGPTVAVSGPIHGRLARGKDEALVERLLATNKPRTIVWTIQFAVSVLMVLWTLIGL